MTTKRQQHSREYKIEAVRLVMNSGKSVATVAGERGICADQLYCWKREFSQSADEAFRGNGVMRSEDDEIARFDFYAVSDPPVPPKASSLFGHEATASLPHRSSFRPNIRTRFGSLKRRSETASAGVCTTRMRRSRGRRGGDWT